MQKKDQARYRDPIKDPSLLELLTKRKARTDKIETVLEKSKLGKRLNYLAIRRMSGDEGLQNSLRDAIRTKLKRYKDAPFILTNPVGPGCNWLPVGPRNINGRIKCLAIHPSNGDIIYAGSAAGGVWKSTDRGQRWVPTMHDEESLAIGAITIAPHDPDTLYAGTGEPVYFQSGGAPPGSSFLAWYYAGAGVYRSTDAGATWTQLGPIENDFIYRIAVDPTNPNILLCAGFSYTTGEGGLCRSTDAGNTWTTIDQGIYTDVLFDPNTGGIAYAAEFNGGVHKSTDNGASWGARNAGLPALSSIGRVNLTIAASNSDVLYAKIENDATGAFLGVFRTDTAAEGAGWTAVGNPGIDSGFLWWCSYIKADPADVTGMTVFSGGVSVARSADGGVTWQRITDDYGGPQPATHPDQHDIVFDPGDTNRFYIANDGGVFHGEYTGGAPLTNWTKVSTGLIATQFYDLHVSKASPTMFGGGAQDNGSMITTGGLSWRNVYGADGGYAAFHPTDPYTVFMQTQSSIQKSIDGGNNFNTSSSGIFGASTFPARVLVIDETSPNILFTGRSNVFRTSNGGTNWNQASNNIGLVTEIAIAPSSSAVIYAGTITGGLHQATNGGIAANSFTNITPGIAGWPSRWLSGIQVDHSNSNILYVTFMGFNNSASGDSDHVWRGEYDPVGGVWSWALIASGLPDVPVGGIVKHSGTGDLYIATDIGVFMSDDDGTSWTPFEAGLPNVPVVDLHLDETSNTLRAATHGRGMYRVKLYATCPEVDLYLRDNILDTGEVTPSPSGIADPTQPGNVVRFYKSADIKVDAPPFDTVDALTDGVEFDNPDHPFGAVYIESIDGIEHNQPIRTQINRVYLQIHNRGWQTANSVTVKLLWADAGAGLPALPADYWSNWPGDGFDQTNWHPLGTTTITNLEPNVPVVLSRNWTPPASVSTHVCLLAMLDSPQDPLLPQTATNVDFLTRNNKKITHRNTHPIDPPAPGTGPAWMGLNFNNAWGEYQFFRFEIKPNGGRIPPMKVFFVDPEPTVFEGIQAKGLRKADLDRQGLEREVKSARGYDRLSDADVDRLLGAQELVCFEIETLAEAAFLDRVWLPPYGQVRAYFMQDFSREQDAPLAAFEVNQYLKDELIGGSEYVIAKKQPETTESCKEQLIRIVLEKVEILDDKDRGIFGKGEIALFSEVKINGSLDRGKQLRFPERGCYRISDKAGQNQQEIDRVLFEGCVCADDILTIDIYGTEHDFDLIGDDFERYHRVFSGNPGSYLGQYTPQDQSPDPEQLKDWMVWYRIERVF